MKFILTHIPIVEDLLVKAIKAYISELRWAEQYPNHTSVNVSNDHPFEKLLDSTGDSPNLFPSITVVSSSDSEIPGMAKGWGMQELLPSDLNGFNGEEWYVSESAVDHLRIGLQQKGRLYGVEHATVWRDSVSFELWSENIQVKNDLYNLLLAFLTGPKILEFKQAHGITIHSNSINGQRSGYYNFDFGRLLYGGRISFSADYSVLQAIYDTDINSFAEIEHSYREVLHG